MIAIYHNLLWSKYKGVIFSRLHSIAESRSVPVSFIQIAETESDRIGLSGVDRSYHTYPYVLLFKGAYGRVPVWRRIFALSKSVLTGNARLVVLPGYDRIEYWAMLVVCILMRKKRAVFCDSTIFDNRQVWWRGLLKRIFFHSCDGFFSYGARSRDYLIKYGADPKKIFQRIQAAALPHDYSAELTLRRRAEAGVAEKPPTFLYVGRLSREKGIETLLGAFVEFKAHHPEAVIRLIGSGPLEDELRQLASALRLGAAVQFGGSKDALGLADEYLAATALVLPSYSEPWGLVVNEALSYGCPVVVSDRCGCVPELVIEGETGFLFSAGDANQLARGLAAAVDLVAQGGAAVSENCVRHVSSYNPTRAAEQLLAGCSEILAE